MSGETNANDNSVILPLGISDRPPTPAEQAQVDAGRAALAEMTGGRAMRAGRRTRAPRRPRTS